MVNPDVRNDHVPGVNELMDILHRIRRDRLVLEDESVYVVECKDRGDIVKIKENRRLPFTVQRNLLPVVDEERVLAGRLCKGLRPCMDAEGLLEHLDRRGLAPGSLDNDALRNSGDTFTKVHSVNQVVQVGYERFHGSPLIRPPW